MYVSSTCSPAVKLARSFICVAHSLQQQQQKRAKICSRVSRSSHQLHPSHTCPALLAFLAYSEHVHVYIYIYTVRMLLFIIFFFYRREAHHRRAQKIGQSARVLNDRALYRTVKRVAGGRWHNLLSASCKCFHLIYLFLLFAVRNVN